MEHTILLVDDEAILALVEAEMLERRGYAVVTAHSGPDAIVAARNPAVDLVLMDIDLGRGMDGTEAAAVILRERDVPIVFLSSHTEPEIVEKTEKITSYGYVVKNSGDTVLDASIKMAYKLFAANNALKVKEQLLTENEERYRLLHEQAGLAIGYYTSEGIVISYNERALTNMNARSEDVVGKSIYDLFPRADADIYMGRITAALDSDEAAEYEDYLDLPIGRVWFSTVVKKIRDEFGAIVGVQFISKDITEKKLAEERLAADLTAMKRLQKLGAMSVGDTSLTSILQEIVETAIKISGADFGNIQLIDQGSGDLRIAAQHGFPQWWIEFWDSVTRGKGACGTALERCERVIVEDVEQSPIFTGTPALDIQRKAGVRAVQSTPLFSRSGKTIGMFSTHYRERCRPDDRALRLLDLLARQAADIIEHAQAEEALHESERKLHDIEKNLPGIIFQARVGPGDTLRFTYVSSRAFDLFGFHLALDDPRWEPGSNMHPDDRERYLLAMRQAIVEGSDFQFEGRFRSVGGTTPWFQALATASRTGGELVYNGVIIDITERKLVERELEASERILAMINKFPDLRALMRGITDYLAEWSGCEAVGIRLRDGEDFPYYESRGFPAEFIRLENNLCATDLDGQLVRDDVGDPVIECMCGNVISGRFDPSKPFFTDHGSFWSNCTTELLATTTEADRQARTRNRCNGMGYESVALIPLRAYGTSFGLLQLNDRLRDRFTPEMIAALERIGDRIGIALSHHRLREELEEREERFRLFVDYTYDWEYWIGPDGGIRHVSPSCERMIGYAAGEFIEDPDLLKRIVHPDDRALFLEHVARSLRPDFVPDDFGIEFRIVAKGGGIVWIAHRCQPVFSMTGKWLGVRGSNRDITDRKKAEELLWESERRYKLVAENSDDVIWLWDIAAGRYKYVSPSVERLRGFTVDEVMEQSLADALPPESLWLLTEELPRRMAEMESGNPESISRTYELNQKCKDGSWVATEVSTTLVRDASGTIAFVQGVARDITARKKAEEELVRANRHLESLWSVVELGNAEPKVICDHILETITRMTESEYGFYGFINGDESAMTIFSWTGNAMRDCSMVDKPQVYAIGESGLWAEAVRRRVPLIVNEYGADHPAKKGYPQGHVPLSRLLVVPVFTSGRITSVAAVANRAREYDEVDVRAVTSFMESVQSVIDRMQAEEELKSAVEEKTALLSELQHRVKNTLTLISSLVSLQASSAPDDRTRAELMDVESRVMSIARLYGQLYQGGQFGRIDLKDYLIRIITGLRESYAFSGDVSIDATIDFATCSFKTASSLGIILNELLTNAFKYAFPEGRTGAVRISLTRRDESFAMHVEDDGAGLPAGFDIEKSKGMGMQLVKLLAKQHRGAVAVDPGGRASFTVTVTAD